MAFANFLIRIQNCLTQSGNKNTLVPMKVLSIVLILISSLSSTAFSSVDICHNQHVNHQQAVSACHTHEDEGSIVQAHVNDSDVAGHFDENSESAESDANHKHCETHCSHYSISLISNNLSVLQFELVQEFHSYKFTFQQTYLEGPFRPPLV